MPKTLFISILSLPLLVIVFISLFTNQIIFLLNAIFYIGLFLLIIGGVLMLLQGAFFYSFISTSKRFFSTINKREQAIKKFEGKNSDRVHFKKNYTSFKYFILFGFIYCLFSLIASIIIVRVGP